jgi:hypothetical protein
MKTRLIFTTLFFSLLLVTNQLLAQVAKPPEIDARHQIVYKCPLEGLKSHDADIRLDCAFVLGEMKYQKAAIPLMGLLRDDPDEAVRIVAAESLIKIDNPVGVFLVSRTAKFNDYAHVRKLCEKFYNAYVYEQYINEHPDATKEEVLAALASQN